MLAVDAWKRQGTLPAPVRPLPEHVREPGARPRPRARWLKRWKSFPEGRLDRRHGCLHRPGAVRRDGLPDPQADLLAAPELAGAGQADGHHRGVVAQAEVSDAMPQFLQAAL